MSTALQPSEIEQQLAQLDGWELRDATIHKTFRLASFPAAISFVTHIGFLAEAAAHHPDIDIRWRKVHVALTTHDASGLTSKDFELATQIDAIFG
jgi:4a-hydroxytetrahydrobiopterin dehydratase